MKNKSFNLKSLVICFGLVFVVSIFGSLFTEETNSEWYDSIRPELSPPNWVFGIAWPILYILIAISLYRSWNNSNRKDKLKLELSYGSNLILNSLWSLFYFGMHNIGLAFVDLALVLGTGIWMTKVAWSIDKKAGLMLVPYILWLSFALILNGQSLF